MNKKELEAFAKQVFKGIKSEQDLTDFRKILTKDNRLGCFKRYQSFKE